MGKIKNLYIIAFVLLGIVSMVLIQFLNGTTLHIYQFANIILCFLTSLLFIKDKKHNNIVSLALFFTVLADMCLVMFRPMEQALGVTFFVMVQLSYFVKILLDSKSKKQNIIHIVIRLISTIIIAIATWLVLKNKTDYVSMISMIYFANLLLNFVFISVNFKNNKILFFAFFLFIMCDIIVGLSSAKGIYFDFTTSPFLDSLLTGTKAWIFYMPSQVLIAISTFNFSKNKKNSY